MDVPVQADLLATDGRGRPGFGSPFFPVGEVYVASKSKRNKSSKAFSATCPACGLAIRLRKMPRKGQFITCFECDTMLEVVRLAPLQLGWAFESPFESPSRDAHDGDPYRTVHYVEDGYDLDQDWVDDDYYDEYRED